MIEAFLSEGLKPAEIARHLGRNRSTINHEIKRGMVKQMKWLNGKQIFYETYFSDTAQRRYANKRQDNYYLKLEKVSQHFLTTFTAAMRAIPRQHSVETFVYTYTVEHTYAIVPSTKTLYTYFHQGLLAIKAIDLPKAVRRRKKNKTRPSTHKHYGLSID